MALESSARRGEVVRVRLDPTEGSEQGGERPAVVISPDYINERAPVLLIAPLTSRKTDRIYAHEVLVEPPDGGVPLRSKAMLMQLRSVARSRILQTYGSVSDETMQRLEEALRIATGLAGLEPVE